MASTGNVFAGTGENVDRAGLTAWTNPGNVVSDNAADATCNGTGSDYLVARNFSLNIPADAVVAGITVRVEASEHSTSTEALNAQIQNDAGALVGSSKPATINGTGKAVYTYGGAADTWGATLTPAIVNDPDFGVRLWFTTAHDVRVDYVTLAVEYGVPVTVSPGVGVGLLAGLAATIALTAHVAVSSGLGVVQASGLSPSVAVTQNAQADTGTGAASLSGLAPTVESGGPGEATPATGTAGLTGFAP